MRRRFRSRVRRAGHPLPGRTRCPERPDSGRRPLRKGVRERAHGELREAGHRLRRRRGKGAGRRQGGGTVRDRLHRGRLRRCLPEVGPSVPSGRRNRPGSGSGSRILRARLRRRERGELRGTGPAIRRRRRRDPGPGAGRGAVRASLWPAKMGRRRRRELLPPRRDVPVRNGCRARRGESGRVFLLGLQARLPAGMLPPSATPSPIPRDRHARDRGAHDAEQGHEAVRHHGGPPRGGPLLRRGDHRPPRRERRGQEHDDQDSPRPGSADLRFGAGSGRGRHPQSPRPLQARIHAGTRLSPLRGARRRVPLPHGRSQRAARGPGPNARGGHAPARRSFRGAAPAPWAPTRPG